MSIAAVLVNHNTSAFAELALRSLFVQNPDVELSLRVYDNTSDDDQTGLRAAAASYGVEIEQSGFRLDSPGNSHGEVLTRFVLDSAHIDASHFLFLDADICFTQLGTVSTLLDALNQQQNVFGVGPRMSWDGQTAMSDELSANPDIYEKRLHPCCALVTNTPIFRSVVDSVGLSCARLLHAEQDDFLDTFELMTRVMRSHGLRHHTVDNALILHAFAVSYPDESSALLPQKQHRRDIWLDRMRQLGSRLPESAPWNPLRAPSQMPAAETSLTLRGLPPNGRHLDFRGEDERLGRPDAGTNSAVQTDLDDSSRRGRVG